MKVEVELPPGVYPTDAEVQELIQKLQVIKAATFKCRLRRLFLERLRDAASIEGKADIAAEIAIAAFVDLIQNTEFKGPCGSIPLGNAYDEGARDFGRELLSRLR